MNLYVVNHIHSSFLKRRESIRLSTDEEYKFKALPNGKTESINVGYNWVFSKNGKSKMTIFHGIRSISIWHQNLKVDFDLATRYTFRTFEEERTIIDYIIGCDRAIDYIQCIGLFLRKNFMKRNLILNLKYYIH
jgi:hypothetical protein